MIVKDNIVIYDSRYDLTVDGTFSTNFKDCTTRLDNAVKYADISVPKPFKGNWYIYDPVENSFELTEIGLAGYKDYLTEKLKDQKIQIEYNGIGIGDKIVKTDLISQQYINGMYNTSLLNPNLSVLFKYANKQWDSIDNVQIEGIARAVSSHVEACFLREFQLFNEINDVSNYTECLNTEQHIYQNWPENI